MFQSESVKKTVRGTVFSESADDTFPTALNPSGEMILFGTAHSRLSAQISHLYIQNAEALASALIFYLIQLLQSRGTVVAGCVGAGAVVGCVGLGAVVGCVGSFFSSKSFLI